MTYPYYFNCSKSTKPIADAIYATKSLGTCARLLEVAGLQDVLRGECGFTLFAPVDEAFRDLAPGTLQSLEDSPRELADMLAYHVLAISRELGELHNGKLRTLQGTMLTASVTDDGINLDHASTCGQSVRCANGVIHPIDRVLMPGFTPAVSEQARALSAWSGRTPVARIPNAQPRDEWPFVEPPPRPADDPAAD
jgi:uncharacterized surface protein with fasciclin (FAS1) repeats